jgi:hypothetical protein
MREGEGEWKRRRIYFFKGNVRGRVREKENKNFKNGRGRGRVRESEILKI